MWPIISIPLQTPLKIWSSNASLFTAQNSPVTDVSKLIKFSMNKLFPCKSIKSGIRAPVYVPKTFTLGSWKNSVNCDLIRPLVSSKYWPKIGSISDRDWETTYSLKT